MSIEKLYRNKGFIINYEEGDSSLQREEFNYTVEDNEDYYTVKENDNLWSISNTYYGNMKFWFAIAEVNNILNPFELEIGSVLLIPSLEKLR